VARPLCRKARWPFNARLRDRRPLTPPPTPLPSAPVAEWRVAWRGRLEERPPAALPVSRRHGSTA
jgi:hypothetical protein